MAKIAFRLSQDLRGGGGKQKKHKQKKREPVDEAALFERFADARIIRFVGTGQNPLYSNLPCAWTEIATAVHWGHTGLHRESASLPSRKSERQPMTTLGGIGTTPPLSPQNPCNINSLHHAGFGLGGCGWGDV